MTQHRNRILLIATVGVIAVAGYAAFAAVQILVLNPLAAAPGSSLDEVYADVATASETLGPARVLVTLGIGVALAIALFVVAAVRPSATPDRTAAGFLVLLVLGTFGYVAASFGPGMALADTLGIGGGDHSPWSAVLYAVSGLATVGLVGVGVRSLSRRAEAPLEPTGG